MLAVTTWILAATGALVDAQTIHGDGTGTAHDFENGRAVRLCSSMAPSADWDASTWTVTSNAPGMSSDDFTPGRWCGYVAQGLT